MADTVNRVSLVTGGPCASESTGVAPGAAGRPTIRLRLAVVRRRHTLLAALASGADPSRDPRLAALAAGLTAPAHREMLAGALARHLDPRRGRPTRAVVHPSAAAVAHNAAAIGDLVERLRRDGPIYARGVARLERLLRHGCGPMYRDRVGGELADALAGIREACDG